MYTQGEWKIVDEGKNGLYVEADTPDVDITICGVYTNTDYVDGRIASSNARLIAAAPDLLKACKLALKTIRECDMEAPLFNMPENEIVNQLESAITKAEGG